jgi:uncharacterized protein (TIGR03118 family)
VGDEPPRDQASFTVGPTPEEKTMNSKQVFRCWLAAGAAALALVACGGGSDNQGYVATALVTDVAGMQNPYSSSTSHVDPNLVNAWGLVFNPQGFVWVANAGTSKSTLYDGNGVPQSLVVAIPPNGAGGEAEPTGIVFNASTSFQVTQNGVTGTISGWSPNVNATNAVLAVDRSAAGAIFKGLAHATQGGADFIYATDFHNGVVAVFDANFAPVTLAAGAFTDPNLPAGFAPFGIQAIGNQLFVTFAKQDANAEDDVAGDGLGALDVFDTAGVLVKRLIVPGGKLNAAWGMAMAPSDFGPFSNDLLVSNFGDGKINAFDPATGNFLGTLSRPSGSAIAIDGLWGIAFGNGLNSQPTNTLFFTGGPADETHGVYGRIDHHN